MSQNDAVSGGSVTVLVHYESKRQLDVHVSHKGKGVTWFLAYTAKQHYKDACARTEQGNLAPHQTLKTFAERTRAQTVQHDTVDLRGPERKPVAGGGTSHATVGEPDAPTETQAQTGQHDTVGLCDRERKPAGEGGTSHAMVREPDAPPKTQTQTGQDDTFGLCGRERKPTGGGGTSYATVGEPDAPTDPQVDLGQVGRRRARRRPSAKEYLQMRKKTEYSGVLKESEEPKEGEASRRVKHPRRVKQTQT